MFVTYFYENPKLNGYSFHPKKGFKHGVEISLWEGDSTELLIHEFLFPFHAWLVETYGYDPDRYEPLFDDEADMVRVYFRDEADLAAFKLIWGEKDGEEFWNDNDGCFREEGIRIGTILHI